MNCVVIGSLIETKLRLLVYLLFAFQVQLTIINDHLNYLKRSITIIKRSPVLPTTNRLGIAIYSNQSRQVLQYQQLTTILNDQNTTIEQATDRLGITIALFNLQLFGSLAKWESILINNQTIIHMKTNIITNLKKGYSIAQTPAQFAKVKQWHNKVSKTVANCHSMLDECDKLDAEFDKVARRMGLN